MRELYRSGDYRVAILDHNNYVIYDIKTKKEKKDKRTGKVSVTYKYEYYYQMEALIKRLCRLVADEECSDLRSWLSEHRNGLATLSTLLETCEKLEVV